MFANFNDNVIPRLNGVHIKINNVTDGKRLLIHLVVIVLFIFSIQIHFFPELRFISVLTYRFLKKLQ